MCLGLLECEGLEIRRGFLCLFRLGRSEHRLLGHGRSVLGRVVLQRLELERRKLLSHLRGFYRFPLFVQRPDQRPQCVHILGIEIERPPSRNLGLREETLLHVQPGRDDVPRRKVWMPVHAVPEQLEGLLGIAGSSIRVGERSKAAAVRVTVGPEQRT